jgi:hypothetical protein
MPSPLAKAECSVDADVPLRFIGVVIQGGGAVIHRAQAGDLTRIE